MPKVLIVEDEELLSNAFRIILEKEGHIVKTAHDGSEALSSVHDLKPDVILLDLLMPGMGGLEFLEKYLPTAPNPRPLIVVLSNLQNEDSIKQATELGADKYMVKSQITPQVLIELVNQLLAA